MNVLTYNPDAMTKATVIPLGRACECRATRIDFYVASWLARFPGGTIALYIKDPNGEMYLADVKAADGMASWVITAADTTVPGYGSLELALIGANGEKKLSAVATTKLETSLVESDPGTEHMQPWIDRAAEIQHDTETAARAAATHAALATTSADAAARAQAAAEAAANGAAGSEKAAADSEKAAETSARDAAASATNASDQASAAAGSAKEAADTLEAATKTIEQARTAAVQAVEAQETESVKAVREASVSAAENAEAARRSATNAAASEMNAAQSANRAEMAATASGWFDVDVNEAGHLIYTRSETVDAIDFEMQEGRLLVNYG